MDRGAWRATVDGIAESQTQLTFCIAKSLVLITGERHCFLIVLKTDALSSQVLGPPVCHNCCKGTCMFFRSPPPLCDRTRLPLVWHYIE